MSREETTESRRVNEMLRNLRGEEYRHHRNINRTRTDILPSSLTHNSPTLPENLVYDVSQGTARPDRLAGPDPPRSWATNQPPLNNVGVRAKPSSSHRERDSAEFRADALSLIIPSSASLIADISILPLTMYCLNIILQKCSQRDIAQIAEHIPVHLRRCLVRLAAVRLPLSDTTLDALRDEGEYIDGECVIVGPHAALQVPQDDHPRVDRVLGKKPLQHRDAHVESWESNLEAPSPPHTLAIISLPLTTSKFLSFPPTITRLALIDLSFPFPIRRLHLMLGQDWLKRLTGANCAIWRSLVYVAVMSHLICVLQSTGGRGVMCKSLRSHASPDEVTSQRERRLKYKWKCARDRGGNKSLLAYVTCEI